MKIYSKAGDLGVTSTLKGQKVSKNSDLMNFLGAADELNSHLGLIKVLLNNEEKEFIENIQINLMMIMSHASDSANEQYLLTDEDVEALENKIDKLSESIKKELEFVLPGKNAAEAQIQITRAVARRAERCFFAVNEKLKFFPNAGRYLNRLSDYLFVLALSST